MFVYRDVTRAARTSIGDREPCAASARANRVGHSRCVVLSCLCVLERSVGRAEGPLSSVSSSAMAVCRSAKSFAKSSLLLVATWISNQANTSGSASCTWETRREVRHQDSIVLVCSTRPTLPKLQVWSSVSSTVHHCSEVHLHQQSAFPVHHLHASCLDDNDPAHDFGQVLDLVQAGYDPAPWPRKRVATSWSPAGSALSATSSRMALASCNFLRACSASTGGPRGTAQ